MFKDKKNDYMPDSASAETIIGPSVKLEGDFKSEGDIVIEGKVNGSLTTKNNLRIGDKAVVRASIEAMSAVVAGTIKGNLSITGKLELSPQATITGDVSCGALVVADGATINGKVSMGKEESRASSASQTSTLKQEVKTTT